MSADKLFEIEFPILRHMFKNNQQGYELRDFRVYMGRENQRLLLLYTSKYHSTRTKVYLEDERNAQGWKIKHVIVDSYSQQRLGLEIMLIKEDKND